MLNIKKSIITKDSFHKDINPDFPLNKKYVNIKKNAYKNIQNIFDSDEKNNEIVSYLDKKRNEEIREKERSISPLLENNIFTGVNNINLFTPTKINKKDFQNISKEKFFNNSEYHKNRNISVNNNISKKYFSKEFSENDEIEKKIKELKIRNQINKKYPIRVTKQNNNLKMTFIRINITTVKHAVEDNYLEEKFDFSINNKSNIEKVKKEFEKESINFFIEGKKKEEDKGDNDNFIGFKLSKIENGKEVKEYYINDSIEELNKKFEEDNIKINDFPLKFKTYNKTINEIDKLEDIEYIKIKNDKKEIKNLIDIGINTIKDKKKFENKGISVNFFPITTQRGVNTDDNIWKYNNNIDDINDDVKKNHYRNYSHNYIERGKHYFTENYYYNKNIRREKLESKNKVTRDKLQKALNEYRSKRIELQEKIYYDESSTNSLQESFGVLERSMVES